MVESAPTWTGDMTSILERIGYFLLELPADWLVGEWTNSLSKDNRHAPVQKRDIRDDPFTRRTSTI